MEIILVRHGETVWNQEGRVQGVSDIELSNVGQDQARRLAWSLKDRPIRTIYASPAKTGLSDCFLHQSLSQH